MYNKNIVYKNIGIAPGFNQSRYKSRVARYRSITNKFKIYKSDFTRIYSAQLRSLFRTQQSLFKYRILAEFNRSLLRVKSFIVRRGLTYSFAVYVRIALHAFMRIIAPAYLR